MKLYGLRFFLEGSYESQTSFSCFFLFELEIHKGTSCFWLLGLNDNALGCGAGNIQRIWSWRYVQ